MPLMPLSKNATRDECTMRNLADVCVSLELLIDVLKLPAGTEILDVIQTPEDRLYKRVTIRVDHNTLPEYHENGSDVPSVNVICERTSCHYDV